MQVLADSIIINVSPAQRALIQNPKFASYVTGMTFGPSRHNRPQILASEIRPLIGRLHELRKIVADDPEYASRRPEKVIDQIILKLEDGAAAQKRAHSPEKFSN